MTTSRYDRAVWNRANENWRRTAVSAHLEQSITGRGIRSRDGEWRVGVVIKLNEVVARTTRPRSTHFGDQERAGGIAFFDSADGLAVYNYCVCRVRQVKE